MAILTLKVSTPPMHATEELQLYSTVSIGWRVTHGMGAMVSLCAPTVRYNHFLWIYNLQIALLLFCDRLITYFISCLLKSFVEDSGITSIVFWRQGLIACFF